MGSKYTTQSASGYNSSPPPDDGSQNASNLITWAGIKNKLADPSKNLADAMNTALVNAFDYSVRQITSSDNTTASDHMRCIEIAPTVTNSVSVALGDAATMTINYRVFIKNSSARNQTVTRVTSGDTIDGTAGNVTMPPGAGAIFQTNSTPNGYLTVAWFGPVSDETALAVASGDGTKKARLELDGLTAGNTRVITVPDADLTMVGTATTQTLTNKTLDFNSNTFNMHGASSAIGADVSLSVAGTYFDGPTLNLGTTGTWLVIGKVCVFDSTSSAIFRAKLWDGTTVIDSARNDSFAINQVAEIYVCGIITNPAASVKISVTDTTNGTGKILANTTGSGKDSSITAIRIG